MNLKINHDYVFILNMHIKTTTIKHQNISSFKY